MFVYHGSYCAEFDACSFIAKFCLYTFEYGFVHISFGNDLTDIEEFPGFLFRRGKSAFFQHSGKKE